MVVSAPLIGIMILSLAAPVPPSPSRDQPSPAAWGAVVPSAAPSLPVAHPLKLSHGRVDVNGAVITLRVRMFWDDLQEAIRFMTEDQRFRIEHTARADSLVGAYLQQVMILEADGDRPVGRVLESGEEDDMFWYIVEYRAPSAIRQLVVRNQIMVDLYPEQRNVLQVRNPSADVNRTFYFSSKREEYALSF
jgi:hypothetical protein